MLILMVSDLKKKQAKAKQKQSSGILIFDQPETKPEIIVSLQLCCLTFMIMTSVVVFTTMNQHVRCRDLVYTSQHTVHMNVQIHRRQKYNTRDA